MSNQMGQGTGDRAAEQGGGGSTNGVGGQGRPITFYINGIIALALLFGLTLLMKPSPEVRYLQALIGVGFAIVVLKMLIRQYRPHWLPDRLGGSRR
jgi:hypothetical protein